MNTDDYTLVCSISKLALKLPAKLTFTTAVVQDKEFSYIFRCESDQIVELDMQTWIDELKEVNRHLQQEVVVLKQKEADLGQSVALLHSVLESTASGIVVFNLAGDIVSCNQEFVSMWQIPNSLTLSKNCSQCQALFESKLKNPQLFRDSMWEVKCDSAGDRYDILELKDGRVFAQHSKPQWLNDKIIGRVWSTWEITEHKISESKLGQTLEQVREVSKLRAHFVYMLCHQFRTPLNVISFSNSLLKRRMNEWTEEKNRPLVERIQIAVEQLSKMLDDILFVAKLEAAKLDVEPKPLNLVRFCNQIVAQIHTCTNQNRINFFNQGHCFTVVIDKKLLEPILKNLLDNAIKYSPSSSMVDLNLSCEPEKIIFQVVDKGIGIPTVDRQRLFEPFYRGSNIANLPGTGLGLSIVKTLVDLHGGHIDVKSEVGVGTTFTIILPLVK